MKINKSPWWWIPTLYFAEGIPYFIVNNISVTMFTRMGVPNDEMALFTSLLYLPWTLKPLWSPIVDIFKTKKWWILTMQLLMSAAFILLTFSIPHPDAAIMSSGSTPIGLFRFSLILFTLTAFASATHDIAADGFYMLALDKSDQSFFVGIRSTFYRLSSIFVQGVVVYIAGILEESTGNVPKAWVLTLGATSLIFAVISVYHIFALPKPASDVSVSVGRGDSGKTSPMQGFKDFMASFVTFFKKPGIVIAMCYLLLYRLPEAFLLKMVNPFLFAPEDLGGLGLTTKTVGLVYGTVGVIALTIGGIIGGIAASAWGLRKSMWPMALALALPCSVFVYLSIFQPTNLWITGTCIAVEQFGYGFGFTAYMLYMIHFSSGQYKTSHYAICTAFMALSMMLPGMVAGYLQKWLGYTDFFWMVMVCCAATVAVTFLARRKIGSDELSENQVDTGSE